MPSRGQAITVSYYAYDTVNSVPKTGDVANHTLRLVKDGGTPAAPTNAPAEIDATNVPGWYKVTLTTAEATVDVVVLGGKSSTAGVVISGTQVTFENFSAIQAKTDLILDAAIGGTVADTGPAAGSFKGVTALSSTDAFYVNSILVFTSGTLKGIARRITGYTGATRLLAFTAAFPVAPANGDAFDILGLGG